ncbi:hypothetical protein PSEUBRA_001136 [Kalmanozyma brasiliensis GHG001]|uniref:Uncharacterized protein n=1 Tax=Kalmanozyma brasiliensis (strain GHG001) TaxID=1365824 RepID=V5EUW2_KALBG|nr:uncharacterized protein PSEUBRA_001136 [Kalmanozyma brasiliensis GHG001]EST09185.1 hypothetical protein PSEUBRA_001136 [Kalmanozyma brasiliensis GHG001]
MTVTFDNADSDEILGELNFTLPDDELDHDARIYLEVGHERPKKPFWKPLHSLRPELDHLRSLSPVEQLPLIRSHLASRGFAIVPHHSSVLSQHGIDDQPAFTAFARENLDLIQRITGADEVILWNATKRQATATTSETSADGYERQSRPQGVESRFDKPMEPPAVFAHIDQDPYQGKRVCAMAIAGHPPLLKDGAMVNPHEAVDADLAGNYGRTMIINLWRPVGGVVYDKPLAIADYRSLDKKCISRWASPYGCGYDVHEDGGQRWHFVPQQTNDEVLVFKCYDSAQEEKGEALYGAHCAVNRVKGGGEVPEGAKPRRSVEFRFVAVWR